MKTKLVAALFAALMASSTAYAMDCCKDGTCACCKDMKKDGGQPKDGEHKH